MTAQEEQETRRLMLGDWLVDPSRDVLSRGGEPTKIEPKAMEVLLFLARRPGVVVTQRELEAAIWRDVIVTPQSLYQVIAQLRRVLGDDARRPRYIETVPRRGYRLVAAVQWADAGSLQPLPTATPATAPPVPPPAPAASPPAAGDPVPGVRGKAGRRTPAWRMGAGIALLLVALLAGAGFLWRKERGGEPPSIAVTTFVNAGAEADSGYLADAVTDELVSALGQVEGLRVVARNSTRSAEKRTADPREVAEQLGVTHVLEGSVRRVEGRVRVTATLVDARTGYQDWSRSFERPAANLLRLPTDIAGSVAGALRLVLLGDAGVSGSRVGTRNPTAYDYYMLGQQRAGERTPFSLAEAERYFQQAIEADGGFAAAHAALAEVYVSEFYYANRPRREAYDLAAPLLDRALELDPGFGLAHALKGLITLEAGDYTQSAEMLTRAAELAPNEARTYLWLGGAWFAQGRLERALAAFDRGLAVDPLNFILHGRRAVLLQNMGRPGEADESAVRAVTLAPRHPNPRWVLALLATWRGETRQAIAHLESALALDAGRSDLRIELGQRWLDLGDTDAAREAFATAARQARGSPLYLESVAYQAVVSGTLGELAPLAESLASIDATDLFLLRDAASFMLLAGEPDKAIELYERAIGLNRDATLEDLRDICGGHFAPAPMLAAAYLAVGRAANGERVLADLETFLGQAEAWGLRCWGAHYQRASIAALRGDAVAAGNHLDEALRLGWREAWWARLDPALAGFRDEAGFQATLERLSGD